jgi:hypothetical protein
LALIGRLILVLVACALASLAAGAVVTLAVLMPEWSALELGPLGDDTFGIAVGFGAIFLSGFAFLPALAVILIAEALEIRALLYYAAAGAIIAALLYLGFSGWDTLALEVNGFARREIEIMAAAGIVAGFVYWAIAGRSAGAWRRPALAPPPPQA